MTFTSNQGNQFMRALKLKSDYSPRPKKLNRKGLCCVGKWTEKWVSGERGRHLAHRMGN